MKILFAGDMCFARFEYLPKREDITYILSDVKPVFESVDYSMVNLECVLYDKQGIPIIKSGPNLKAQSGFVDYLKELSVDVAGLANNHIGDYGAEAICATMKILKDNGISFIGAGENIEEAYRAHIFEKDGLRVSVIAACENEFGVADEHTPGAAGFNLYRLSHRIREEKKKADYVLFYFHGGNENNPFPSPRKTELYRHIADIGADAVIAMHTHCPQGYEVYHGKPIVYSMGNFYFPPIEGQYENTDASWFFGYMSVLEFTADGIDLAVLPYHFGYKSDPIAMLTNENLDFFTAYLNKLCQPLKDETEIRRLFNIWSTISGMDYSRAVHFKPEMLENSALQSASLRNIFGCEAHDELLCVLTELCYRERVQEFAARQPEIKELQTIVLPRHQKISCQSN